MRGLLILCMLAAAPVMAQQTPAGYWMTQSGTGVIGLQPCEAGLCGTIDGLTGFQPSGAPPVDIHGQSRCHLMIIPDLQLEDSATWAGHITNPDDGKTYTIHISLDAHGRLDMRGFIGIPLLGRTTVWTRFQGHLTPDCHIQHG